MLRTAEGNRGDGSRRLTRAPNRKRLRLLLSMHCLSPLCSVIFFSVEDPGCIYCRMLELVRIFNGPVTLRSPIIYSDDHLSVIDRQKSMSTHKDRVC